jgi:hypothetical protein
VSVLPGEYKVWCMALPCGVVTLARAAELFAENPDDRTGSLGDGFSYWMPGEFMRRLVRVDVRPVRVHAGRKG